MVPAPRRRGERLQHHAPPPQPLGEGSGEITEEGRRAPGDGRVLAVHEGGREVRPEEPRQLVQEARLSHPARPVQEQRRRVARAEQAGLDPLRDVLSSGEDGVRRLGHGIAEDERVRDLPRRPGQAPPLRLQQPTPLVRHAEET